MFNIFNHFLFLLLCWLIFMVIGNNFSWFYFGFGLVSSFLVALWSYYVKIINKESKFLFLSIGFYRYFIFHYLDNLFNGLWTIIKIFFGIKKINPVIYNLKIESEDKIIDLPLLISSINLIVGLMVIEANQNYILIHAIDEQSLENLNFNKIKKNLLTVNDDEIV